MLGIVVALLVTAPVASAAAPSFGSPLSFDAGTNAGGVAIADFNGDGIPDLAIINAAPSTGACSVTVWLGDGNGGFTNGGVRHKCGPPLKVNPSSDNRDLSTHLSTHL